ncbi:NAD(P)-binding protein [Collybia nuda]|uniref:NAD(P)-binding protein n=1 Tax=Collybia nuda TaxID=64659 RepID=A0A9P5Y0R5_9AGAR|nr:NAD(P)-binding protein [Collybia nuda]
MSQATKGVAIVTGAAQGIGRAIALRLALDGFNVGVNDIISQQDKLESLSAEIRALGREACIVPADVSDEVSVEKMIKDVVSNLGGVDVMVSNAGICELSPIVNTTSQQWDKHQNVNLRGTFLCFKYAAIQMIEQGRGGSIIGGSSLAGFSGIPMGSAYAASKAGMRTLTHTAAREWGRNKITVNSYAPGMFAAKFLLRLLLPDVSHYLLIISTRQQKNVSAMGENGAPEDIAGLVSFLASKDARFITGN